MSTNEIIFEGESSQETLDKFDVWWEKIGAPTISVFHEGRPITDPPEYRQRGEILMFDLRSECGKFFLHVVYRI